MRMLTVMAMLAPMAAQAQQVTCADQAAFIHGTVPGMQTQLGYETAQDFLNSETRLLDSISLYAAAANVLAGRAPDFDLPREYWLENILVVDGLVRCFQDDETAFTPEQTERRDVFFATYTREVRVQLATAALSEMGEMGLLE